MAWGQRHSRLPPTPFVRMDFALCWIIESGSESKGFRAKKGANRISDSQPILNLSPGTHSWTSIGVSSPIRADILTSWERSNTFDFGFVSWIELNKFFIVVFLKFKKRFFPLARVKNPSPQGGYLHWVTVAPPQSSIFKGGYRHEQRSICVIFWNAYHVWRNALNSFFFA